MFFFAEEFRDDTGSYNDPDYLYYTNSIVYGNGVFLICAYADDEDGSDYIVYFTSTDGINWSYYTNTNFSDTPVYCYGDNGFVAVYKNKAYILLMVRIGQELIIFQTQLLLGEK